MLSAQDDFVSVCNPLKMSLSVQVLSTKHKYSTLDEYTYNLLGIFMIQHQVYNLEQKIVSGPWLWFWYCANGIHLMKSFLVLSHSVWVGSPLVCNGCNVSAMKPFISLQCATRSMHWLQWMCDKAFYFFVMCHTYQQVTSFPFYTLKAARMVCVLE